MSLLLRSLNHHDPFDDFFFGWEPFLAPVLRSEDQVASKRAASSSMKPYTPILYADLVENESGLTIKCMWTSQASTKPISTCPSTKES